MTTAGYSGTPLAKKLGIKDNFIIMLINEPAGYKELLDPLPDAVQFGKNEKAADMIHYFEKDANEFFRRLPLLKKQIRSNGMIWISWPKKASKVPTDITEDIIRHEALKTGLVDVKVCAVNEIWSGLKLVIPVKDRK